MENLKDKIAGDQKNALKDGDALRLSTLRMLSAAVANKEIELRKKDVGLSDQEILGVISSEAKKRKDAAQGYRTGAREELAQKEEVELKILQSYLPPEISEEDLRRIIKDGIREAGLPAKAGVKSQQYFAKVMKVIMPTLKGKASGDRISSALKEELEKTA